MIKESMHIDMAVSTTDFICGMLLNTGFQQYVAQEAKGHSERGDLKPGEKTLRHRINDAVEVFTKSVSAMQVPYTLANVKEAAAMSDIFKPVPSTESAAECLPIDYEASAADYPSATSAPICDDGLRDDTALSDTIMRNLL